MRTTHALVQVALTLMDNPTGQHWGYELSKNTGVRSGVLYPMLTRMLEQGWLTDGWEDPTTIQRKPPTTALLRTHRPRPSHPRRRPPGSPQRRPVRRPALAVGVMVELLDITWPGLVVALVAFGFAPGFCLRLIVLLSPRRPPPD